MDNQSITAVLRRRLLITALLLVQWPVGLVPGWAATHHPGDEVAFYLTTYGEVLAAEDPQVATAQRCPGERIPEPNSGASVSRSRAGTCHPPCASLTEGVRSLAPGSRTASALLRDVVSYHGADESSDHRKGA